MNFGLIIIGDEILSGKRADKHMPRVIELLAARGLALTWVRYVGDDPQRITAELQLAFASGDVVFSCGGIGATPDDHTRQCAGAALGVPMALHPDARALILERAQDMAREQGRPFDANEADNVHRMNMGVFPVGAQIIPNPYNKIPGFSVQPSGAGIGRAGVFFMPGFPVMAWPMIEWVLDQLFADLHRDVVCREMSVIAFAANEAALTPLMMDIEARYAGIKVFSLPSVDDPILGRHIEIGVKGPAEGLDAAYRSLLDGLSGQGVRLGPELVR